MNPSFLVVATGVLVLNAEFFGVWEFSSWPQRGGRDCRCLVPNPDQIRCDAIEPTLLEWPCGAPIDVIAFAWQESATPMRATVAYASGAFSGLDADASGSVDADDLALATGASGGEFWDWNLDGSADAWDRVSFVQRWISELPRGAGRGGLPGGCR